MARSKTRVSQREAPDPQDKVRVKLTLSPQRKSRFPRVESSGLSNEGEAAAIGWLAQGMTLAQVAGSLRAHYPAYAQRIIGEPPVGVEDDLSATREIEEDLRGAP